MKDFEESMALMTAVERFFNEKPASYEKAKAVKYLQVLKVQLKMTEYQDCKGKINSIHAYIIVFIVFSI